MENGDVLRRLSELLIGSENRHFTNGWMWDEMEFET